MFSRGSSTVITLRVLGTPLSSVDIVVDLPESTTPEDDCTALGSHGPHQHGDLCGEIAKLLQRQRFFLGIDWRDPHGDLRAFVTGHRRPAQHELSKLCQVDEDPALGLDSAIENGSLTPLAVWYATPAIDESVAVGKWNRGGATYLPSMVNRTSLRGWAVKMFR